MQDPIAQSADAAPASLARVTGLALTPGYAGNEVQCIGVLEALGIEPVVKRVSLGLPWRWLAPHGPAQPQADIALPWPDLLLASGRRAVPHARMIRRRSGGRTFVAFLQNPRVSPENFDLVWVPRHDGLAGDNVVATLTSPHRLTPARLAAAAEAHAPKVAHLPRPLVCVLVGGSSGSFRLGRPEAERLGEDLALFAARHCCGLLVTPSRRTGRDIVAILQARLADAPAVVWNLEGDNPYFGHMGLAEAFVVTCESANMLGEAAFTGKPLYAYRLPGGNQRFARLHAEMKEHGALRWFDGGFESWTYPPLDATLTVAAAIRERFAAPRRPFHSA